MVPFIMDKVDTINQLYLFGIPISPFVSYSDTCNLVKKVIDSKEKLFCVAVNPEKIYQARKKLELTRLIKKANMHICDGVGVGIAVRILYGKKIKRITGVQLFYELIKRAEQEGWKIFLLGASEETNIKAYEKLIKKHPKIRIVGRQNGYFKDSSTVLNRINASGAQLLFVAIGSPKQENWIAEHRDHLNPAFCMGVGGTFDVVSGRVKWAPAIFRKTGSEFLYRLITQPKRFKRQSCYPVFMILVIYKKLKMVLGKKHNENYNTNAK